MLYLTSAKGNFQEVNDQEEGLPKERQISGRKTTNRNFLERKRLVRMATKRYFQEVKDQMRKRFNQIAKTEDTSNSIGSTKTILINAAVSNSMGGLLPGNLVVKNNY